MFKSETLFVKVTESKNLARLCHIFSWLEQVTYRHIPCVAGAKKERGGEGRGGEKSAKGKRERQSFPSLPHPLSFFLPPFPSPPLSTPATQDNHHKIQHLPVPNVSVQPILKCG